MKKQEELSATVKSHLPAIINKIKAKTISSV
jgi:hypothetical protein